MSEHETELASQVHAPTLLVRLAAMIRTARIHDVTNTAFRRQLQDFYDVLMLAMEQESELGFMSVAGYLYINGTRIRADGTLLGVYHMLLSELAKRSVGGVKFHRGVEVPELEQFFHHFMMADHKTKPQDLAEAVARANLEHIQVLAVSEIEAEEIASRLQEQVRRTGSGYDGSSPGSGNGQGNGDGSGNGEAGDGSGLAGERKRAQQVFTKAVTGTHRIMAHAMKTGRADLRFAKRLIQPVVDNIMKNETSIIGLTALKSHDEYTYAHCVNVSTLSVSMGYVMGIPRPVLADLGVAALIHDIGKIAVPADVLRKPGKLNDDEWRAMRRHPIEGMKMMMDMPGLSLLTLDSMRTCLEHHMGAHLKGYPKSESGWTQGALSRIVAMADCYDAMTAHRAYRRRPFTPFEALRRLLGPDREQFDPSVRWALLKTVGIYPPGSILQVDSGHLVLSMSPNVADPRRPNCKVLRRPDGTSPPDDAPEHWEPMAADVRVVRVLSPEDCDINPDDHLKSFA